jgi:hypothetical protein
VGGKLIIDFFSEDDLRGILDIVNASLLRTSNPVSHMLEKFVAAQTQTRAEEIENTDAEETPIDDSGVTLDEPLETPDTTPEEVTLNKKESSDTKTEEDIYSITRFTI